MRKIKRHPFTESKIGTEELVRIYYGRKKTVLERLSSGKKVNLHMAKDSMIGAVRTKYLLGIEQRPLTDYIDYLDMGIAHFERVQATTDKVKIKVSDQAFTVDAIESDYGAECYNAYQLYNVAKIVRSKAHLDKIVNYQLPFSKQAKDPFWEAVFEYLQYMEVGNIEKREATFHNIHAIAQTDRTVLIGLKENKEIDYEGISHTRQVYHFPIIDLYEKIQLKQEAAFNETLYNYLTIKKQDLIANDQIDNPNYWIDFDLLGVLATAEDHAIDIQVVTDYAPEVLFSKL